MYVLFVVVLLFSISGYNLLPVEDKDIDILEPNTDFESNSLYGGVGGIDLSSLGPEAYVSPNNNSGE